MTTTTSTPAAVLPLRERFKALADDWRAKALFKSNTASMVLLRPYQTIISLGEPVVPLLLEELRREPNHWFWALEVITGEDPVPVEDRGNVRRSAAAWVEWGVQRGLIPA